MTPLLAPAQMNAAFAVAFNSRQLDALTALYESHAIHVGPDGQQDQGIMEITQGLKQLLSVGGIMNSTNLEVIQTGELALLRAHWTINTLDHTAQSPRLSGQSVEVVRRQPDGRWLYVIDHPWGASALQT